MQPRISDRSFEKYTGILVALACGALVAVTALDVWRAYQVDSALYEMEQASKRLQENLSEGGEEFSTNEADREIGI